MENHTWGQRSPQRAAVLFVVCVLLGAALIVIYRLSFALIKTVGTLRNLELKLETIKNSPIDEPFLRCEEGWEQHRETCYYLSTRKLSWNKSRDYCRAKGGDLVKIDSMEEQEFLVEKIRYKMKDSEDKFWIGLTDSASEGTWLWTDGSPLNKSLTFWIRQEPDDWKKEDPEGEDCVRMGEIIEPVIKCWFDTSCKVPHKSICEKLPEIPGSKIPMSQ